MKSPRFISLVSILAAASLLAACGGGGGGGGGDNGGTGGGGNPPPAPEPAPTLQGTALLGAISGATVIVSGTDGELARTTTDSVGNFGPIEYDEEYEGPLRITIEGSDTARFECDVLSGCRFDAVDYAFGELVPFRSSLEAVLAEADGDQRVTVSVLSDLISQRVRVTDNFTTLGVERANRDVLLAFDPSLADVEALIGEPFPESYAEIPLIDPVRPAPQDSTFLTALFSLQNVTFLMVGDPEQPVDALIERLRSSTLVTDLQLQVGSPDGFGFTLDALSVALRDLSAAYVLDRNDPFVTALQPRFDPLLIDDFLRAAEDTLDVLPTIDVVSLRDTIVDNVSFRQQADLADVVPAETVVIRLPDDDAQLGQDVDLRFDPEVPWASAEAFVDGDNLIVQLVPSEVAALVNGQYLTTLTLFSPSGRFVRREIPIELDLSYPVITAAAAAPGVGVEREDLSLALETNRPNGIASAQWRQLDGPDAVIGDPTSADTVLTLPNVTEDGVLTLELDVLFRTGERFTLPVTIDITAKPSIDSELVTDPALRACLASLAASQGFEELAEITSLNCDGVQSLAGLSAFESVTRITLPNNELTLESALDIVPLLASDTLVSIDFTPSPNGFPCEIRDLDQLPVGYEGRPGGPRVTYPGWCQSTGRIPLRGNAADIDVAPSIGGQSSAAVIVVADRDEDAAEGVADAIITVDQDFGLAKRQLLPAPPAGIDVSEDTTVVYVALSHSNAVAVLSTDPRIQRIEEIIPLGSAGMGMNPVDVVEVAPQRLFVAFDDGADTARIVELDTITRAVTVVADDIPIDASPRLLVDSNGSRVFITNTQQPYLYAIDLTDPNRGVLADSGLALTVPPTDTPTLTGTGNRLLLDTGDVVDTASLMPIAQLGAGAVATSVDGQELLRVIGPGAIAQVDAEALVTINEFKAVGCEGTQGLRAFPYVDEISQLFVEGPRDVLAFAQPGEVCLVAQHIFDTLPYIDLSFLAQTMPDFSLYSCAREQLFDRLGSATDFIRPENLDALTCTRSSVLSIRGLENFRQLRSLDVTGNLVTTLAPLAPSAQTGSPGVPLETLTANDLPLVDASAILEMPSLRNVSLRDSNAVPCTQVDAIATLGLTTFSPPTSCHEPRTLTLGAEGGDMVIDEANGRVLVSLPALSEVLAISVPAMAVEQRYAFSNSPQGLELSADGSTLYVAFSDTPAIAYLDLGTGMISTVDLGPALDAPAAWDIAEVAPDQLLVTGSGSAFIVEVRRHQANATARVAGELRTNGSPRIAVARDAGAVYVGDTGILRLDGNSPGLPVTAQRDNFGEHLRSYSAASGGEWLYLGPVLNGDTLAHEGFRRGEAAFVRDSDDVLAPVPHQGWVDEYEEIETERSGGLFEGRRLLGCQLPSVTAFGPIETPRESLISLGGDQLCLAFDVLYAP